MAQRSSRMRTGASIRASAGSRWRGAMPACGGLPHRSRWARSRHSSPGCARRPAGGAVALGVDLPIGLPRAYAAGLPERDFLHFLTTTATRPDFFQVCATLAEVGPGRPFYPARGVRGMTRAAHAAALGLDGAAALSRACDRATAERPAGRAAVLDARGEPGRARRRSRPGSRCCCRRWPAATTSGSGRSPAPSGRCWRRARWRWRRPIRPRRCAISASGSRAASGGRRTGRRSRTSLPAAMAALAVLPDPELQQATADGFGSDAAGEDRFDCVLGVLCVLNVLAGNRPDTAPADPWIRRWEGWVLGQTAMPADWRGGQHVAACGLAGRQRNGAPRQDAPKVAFGNGHHPARAR